MDSDKPVSIREAAAALTDPWQPRDLVLERPETKQYGN